MKSLYYRTIITIVEWIYLIYMFFFFKTTYHIQWAYADTMTRQHTWLVHDTGYYESKICPLGKLLVIVFIIFSLYRLRKSHGLLYETIVFDCIAIVLAFLLNWNALVYLLPVLVLEVLYYW